VSHWVRMKCMFGCPSYGNCATCPPNVPSIEESRAFISEYGRGVLFHFTKKVDKPEERKEWSLQTTRKLIEVERKVFLMGFFKAFLLNLDECRLCENCPGQRSACNFPKQARPSMESMGVDVFSTVRRFGLPIQVLDNYDKEMNRFALLLIE